MPDDMDDLLLRIATDMMRCMAAPPSQLRILDPNEPLDADPLIPWELTDQDANLLKLYKIATD